MNTRILGIAIIFHVLVAQEALGARLPNTNDVVCEPELEDPTYCKPWLYPHPTVCCMYIECDSLCQTTEMMCDSPNNQSLHFSYNDQACVAPEKSNCTEPKDSSSCTKPTTVPPTTTPAPIESTAGPYGTVNGGSFNDSIAAKNGPITAIHLDCGYLVDGIMFRYGSVWGPYNGGTGGGTTYEFIFDSDEYITSINVRSGNGIDQLQFFTNKQTLPACGPANGGGPYLATGHPNSRLNYISGWTASYINGITFYFIDL